MVKINYILILFLFLLGCQSNPPSIEEKKFRDFCKHWRESKEYERSITDAEFEMIKTRLNGQSREYLIEMMGKPDFIRKNVVYYQYIPCLIMSFTIEFRIDKDNHIYDIKQYD